MPSPNRPRVAEHVLARRHVVSGREFVVLQDQARGQQYQLGAREWAVLSQADGSRDLRGIVLAARGRGVVVAEAQVQDLLDSLADQGMLTEGPPAWSPDEVEVGGDFKGIPEDCPVERLRGFTMRCDGRGGCCQRYGSVLFTPGDVARARAWVPHRGVGPVASSRMFLPVRGSAPLPIQVPTMSCGRCGYLDADDLCSIHKAGGVEAKPWGCAAYPLTLAFDGRCVRASVAVECACVLASVGRTDGEPVLSEEIHVAADLPRWLAIEHVPEQVEVAAGEVVGRAEFRQFCARWLAAPEPRDCAATVWNVARQLEARGLDGIAFEVEAPKPSCAELAQWFGRLRRRVVARHHLERTWRDPQDQVRKALQWMSMVLVLLEGEGLPALVSDPPRTPGLEVFYLRSLVFGYRLAARNSLVDDLRAVAVRMWLARAMEQCPLTDDVSSKWPLSLVESVTRGHGLESSP